jgi:hypothetical protein
MSDDRCNLCGASLALVGRAHRCVPQPERSFNPPAPDTANAVTHVTHSSVTHADAVTHTTSKGAARQARYRAKDPDAYRERHRELMRKWRANPRMAIVALST